MIKSIWKFILVPDILVKVRMPVDTTILFVGEQNNKICIWAEVNPEAKTEERNFEVYGTGHNIHYDMGTNRKYLGTAMLYSGSLVFHVYEYLGV